MAQALEGIRLPEVTEPAQTRGRLLLGDRDLQALRARRVVEPYATWYRRIKQLVDGRLQSQLDSLDDELLARIAKGAALMNRLGEQPPGSATSTYAAFSLSAIRAMRTRTPTTAAGLGDVDPLRDSGGLQSMVEALDLVADSGADLAAARQRIESWADALADDLLLPAFVNNHQIKAGAALVTAALGLPDAPRASAWLDAGMRYLNGALARMASRTGWYREGPHYLNYSLNNLASTAYHVLHMTGVSWFGALEPICRFALATRQPDGSSQPFEEGIPNVFPFHLMAPAYANTPLGREMIWAWQQSSQDTVNFENQQLHEATAFVLYDDTIVATPPAASPTRFFGDDTNVSVLRGDYSSASLQSTLFSAIDFDASELIESRHHTRNPLDLVVSGAGALLLPTSGGGPLVTRSDDRAYYLDPASKNLVLVGGSAPYLLSTDDVTLSGRLDSHHASGAPGLCDLATTQVRGYAGGATVTRTAAMIDGRYLVVADEAAAPAPVEIDVAWHGRGERLLTEPGDPARVVWRTGTSRLFLAATAQPAPRLAEFAGKHAPRWGEEEPIAGIRFATADAHPLLLAVLAPLADGELSPEVTRIEAAQTVALRIVHSGNIVDEVGHSGSGASWLDVASDAGLLLLRRGATGIDGLAAREATSIHVANEPLLGATSPITAVVSSEGTTIRVVVSIDQPRERSVLTLGRVAGLDPDREYRVLIDGASAGSDRFCQESNGVAVAIDGPGRVELTTTGQPAPERRETCAYLREPPSATSTSGCDGTGSQDPASGAAAAILLLLLSLGQQLRR